MNAATPMREVDVCPVGEAEHFELLGVGVVLYESSAASVGSHAEMKGGRLGRFLVRAGDHEPARCGF